MAIALGFHRKNPEGVYTAVEREEGKRAWWLCYVVERFVPLIFQFSTATLLTASQNIRHSLRPPRCNRRRKLRRHPPKPLLRSPRRRPP